jgi:hypothetical protein
VSSVKYELGFYIPEDDILHSHRRENLKSYNRGVFCCFCPKQMKEILLWILKIHLILSFVFICRFIKLVVVQLTK